MQIMISDGKTEYWYDVTGMQSLAQKLTMQTAGGTLVRKVAEEICGLKTELEEYLLQDTDIVYDPEMIFMDRKETSVKFCYIPGFGTAKKAVSKAFWKNFCSAWIIRMPPQFVWLTDYMNGAKRMI